MPALPSETEFVNSSDPDEVATELSPLFGSVVLEAPGGGAKFHCRMSYLSLGDVGIFHGQYEAGFSLLFHDFNVFAGSPAPLKGTGEHSIGGKDVTVCEAKGVVVAPGLALLRYGPEFEHLSITVRPAALTSKLSAILGDLRLGPLRFDPVVNGGDPELRRLNRLIRFVAAEADNSWPLPPIIQAELQQTMMVSFLQSYANNYSALLRGEPIATAPWHPRRGGIH